MNNSVKTLIVRSFNEGHQGLLERNVPSGWGGLGESGGGGVRYLQNRESFLTQKNNMWGGSPEPIEILFTFWRGFEGL